MHAILLASALVAGPTEADCACSHTAANVIHAYSQTGTLIFSQGDCLAVKFFTKSPYTHVAAVVIEDGQPFVYDSMNGVGVRKLSLEKYCQSECPNTMHVYKPAAPLSPHRRELFVKHLKSELGRKYGVKHHFSGKRADGVHCSEYVMDALAACRLMHADRPAKVSPDSLRQGVEQTGLYQRAAIINLSKPVQKETGRNWCEQLWIDTKVCTNRSFGQMGRWFACK